MVFPSKLCLTSVVCLTWSKAASGFNSPRIGLLLSFARMMGLSGMVMLDPGICFPEMSTACGGLVPSITCVWAFALAGAVAFELTAAFELACAFELALVLFSCTSAPVGG